jgi:hypothetical protein
MVQLIGSHAVDPTVRDVGDECAESVVTNRWEMMDQDFSCRSHQPEMMDGDAIGFEEFQNCLRGLEIVNVCTLAYRPMLWWLKKMLRGVKSQEPVFILDVGSGGHSALVWANVMSETPNKPPG